MCVAVALYVILTRTCRNKGTVIGGSAGEEGGGLWGLTPLASSPIENFKDVLVQKRKAKKVQHFLVL